MFLTHFTSHFSANSPLVTLTSYGLSLTIYLPKLCMRSVFFWQSLAVVVCFHSGVRTDDQHVSALHHHHQNSKWWVNLQIGSSSSIPVVYDKEVWSSFRGSWWNNTLLRYFKVFFPLICQPCVCHVSMSYLWLKTHWGGHIMLYIRHHLVCLLTVFMW